MSERALVPASPAAAKARMVTHAANSLLQRKCECGGSAGSAGFENDCEDCKKKKLQRRAAGSGPATAPAIVHDVLRAPGQPLDQQTRSFFEHRFGHDFSQVRVHTDSRAVASAQAMSAQAYAVGQDLVFGAGRFAPDTTAGRQLLAHELTHVVQQSHDGRAAVQRKLEVGPVNDALEQEAERFAEEISSDRSVSGGWPIPPPSQGSGRKVQRATDDSAGDPSAPAAATVAPDTGLIVEDEATEVGPGQMRKTEFLDGLHDSACATADSELKAVGRSAQGCPLIERWIAKLRTRDSQYIERAIRKYAPESVHASAAREYFATVGQRVRKGVNRWATTGEISDVPPELISEMGGGGILGALGGAVSSIVGAIGGAVSSITAALGSAISGVGKLFTKARAGGAREASPAAIQARLGPGTALDGGVRTRMESAFGHDFSRVRVHADSRAAELSSGINARAFTIGNQVGFGAGEYRPGTLLGDALIAHELAHVVQQGSVASAGPLNQGNPDYDNLEEDADRSAVGAMIALWTGTKRALNGIVANAVPRLRSGLKLQRCGGAQAAAAGPNLATSPDLKKSWDAALKEGLALLDASTAKKGTEKGCAFPGKKKPEDWNYNKGSWSLQLGGRAGELYSQVSYVPKKAPHESVDDLFSGLEQWECDCALFAELSWLYAWRHTLSDEDFDKKFHDLRLRPQGSTGMERETHRAENIEMGIEEGSKGQSFDQMWSNAPVGTKVVWKNTSSVAESPWEFENAIKKVKGSSDDTDRYDAHPLGNDLSEDQVKLGLAENAADFPGNTFTVTASTLQQLTAAGAPAPFVTNLQSLAGKTFVGKPAFIAALKDPAQALVQLRQQDRAGYEELLKKVFDFSHAPATEDQKKAYVSTYIKRWEIQIPK